jgi:hypothetical protein
VEKEGPTLDLNGEDGSPAAVTLMTGVAERILTANLIFVCAASFLF